MPFLRGAIWCVIAMCFVRGLWVWDMGPSANDSYPIASAICFGASAVAAAIMPASDRQFMGKKDGPDGSL